MKSKFLKNPSKTSIFFAFALILTSCGDPSSSQNTVDEEAVKDEIQEVLDSYENYDFFNLKKFSCNYEKNITTSGNSPEISSKYDLVFDFSNSDNFYYQLEYEQSVSGIIYESKKYQLDGTATYYTETTLENDGQVETSEQLTYEDMSNIYDIVYGDLFNELLIQNLEKTMQNHHILSTTDGNLSYSHKEDNSLTISLRNGLFSESYNENSLIHTISASFVGNNLGLVTYGYINDSYPQNVGSEIYQYETTTFNLTYEEDVTELDLF